MRAKLNLPLEELRASSQMNLDKGTTLAKIIFYCLFIVLVAAVLSL